MARTSGRKGRPHRRISAILKLHLPGTPGPVCWICGEFIDLALHALNPNHRLSFTVDHVIPLSRGGLPTLENSRPAHRKCNSSKGNRPHRPTLNTSQEW